MASEQVRCGWRGHWLARPAPPLFVLQPLLSHVVRGVARRHPEIFERLGTHQASRFLIEPKGLPFALYLRPDARAPVLRALPLHARPKHDARITASIVQMLRMIDSEQDGDAIFFSRDLAVSGDTEAVVTLRNAVDNMDGSLAASVAEMFGPPGRLALALLRRRMRNMKS